MGISSLGLAGNPLEELDLGECVGEDWHSSSLKRGGRAGREDGTVPTNSTESSSTADRDMMRGGARLGASSGGRREGRRAGRRAGRRQGRREGFRMWEAWNDD